MLHPRRHRLTTLLLLAAYLAANMFSGLLHDHAEPAGGATACCGHTDHEHAAGEHASSELVGIGSAPANGTATHDDDCTVCRFVGQRVLPVAGGPMGTWTELSVELSLVHACQPVATILRTTHCRAPPLVG
jgi:hypothetical protein